MDHAEVGPDCSRGAVMRGSAPGRGDGTRGAYGQLRGNEEGGASGEGAKAKPPYLFGGCGGTARRREHRRRVHDSPANYDGVNKYKTIIGEHAFISAATPRWWPRSPWARGGRSWARGVGHHEGPCGRRSGGAARAASKKNVHRKKVRFRGFISENCGREMPLRGGDILRVKRWWEQGLFQRS